MAVRREVVSFSQLLQRRSNNQREPSLSLSQASATASMASSGSQCVPRVPNSSSVQGSGAFNSYGESRHHRDGLQGLQPRPQVPAMHDHSGSSNSFQSAMHSQHSHPDNYTTRPWSQSQEETSWSGYMTSQSQSQTQTSMSQPPPPSIPSANRDERPNQVPHNQPRSFLQHSKFAKLLLDSGKRSLSSSTGDTRREEEMLSRLVDPVNDTLKEIKSMLAHQTERQTQQAVVQSQMGEEIRSVNESIESLQEQFKKTKRNCEDCHEKMGREAAAARRAFESMGSRMGAMEKNVDAFISNMTVFVREELFALHVQRESAHPTSAVKAPILSTDTRRLTKRRLAEQTPVPVRRYAPLPCSTTPKNRSPRSSSRCRGSSVGSVETKKPANADCRRSKRIQRKRAKEERDAERTNSKGNSERSSDDDVFGIQLALARVEEARAKRRREV